MTISVSYPSGLTYTVQAEWLGLWQHGPVLRLTETQEVLGTAMQAGKTLLVDFRGVYRDVEHGTILYSPRERLTELPREMHTWLSQHPEWPGDR